VAKVDRVPLADIGAGAENASRKTPPNSPCPCGAGKKYKKCCGSSVMNFWSAPAAPAELLDPALVVALSKAEDYIKKDRREKARRHLTTHCASHA